MSLSSLLPRTVARSAALSVGVVTLGLVGLPAAHAKTFSTSLVLAAGQSGSIGRVVTNTDVTPVSTCDPELSVSFDATMAGTVTVAPSAALGVYTCSVDFQVDGQSTGLLQAVSVTVVPGLSINDVALAEGSVGVEPGIVTSTGGLTPDADGIPPTLFTFTVTLSEPSTSPVTVRAVTADGTASSTGTSTTLPDYTPVDTTLTFAPGVTSQPVTVQVIREDLVEPAETFFVNLSAPTGAVIVDGQGVGTIGNDDRGPIVR